MPVCLSSAWWEEVCDQILICFWINCQARILHNVYTYCSGTTHFILWRNIPWKNAFLLKISCLKFWLEPWSLVGLLFASVFIISSHDKPTIITLDYSASFQHSQKKNDEKRFLKIRFHAKDWKKVNSFHITRICSGMYLRTSASTEECSGHIPVAKIICYILAVRLESVLK